MLAIKITTVMLMTPNIANNYFLTKFSELTGSLGYFQVQILLSIIYVL